MNYTLTTYQNGILARDRSLPKYLIRRRPIHDLREVGRNLGYPFFNIDEAESFARQCGGKITQRIVDPESEFVL